MGAVLFNLPVPDPPEGGVVAQGVEETIRAVSRDPEVASVYAGLMASVRTMAWQADRMGEAGRPSGRAQFFKTLNEALTTLAEDNAWITTATIPLPTPRTHPTPLEKTA